MSQVPDTFGCIKSTIKVYAGHYFDLQRPNPDDVDIETIAHVLSRICRYGGHCPQFYSVAEHCLQCARLATLDGLSVDAVRAVMLHDAAEAYIGDMVKPLKVMIPQYQEIESLVELAIDRKFNCKFDHYSETIKKYDRAMLKAEKTAMWPDDAEHWAGFETIPLVRVQLRYWTPHEANDEFLKAWSELSCN